MDSISMGPKRANRTPSSAGPEIFLAWISNFAIVLVNAVEFRQPGRLHLRSVSSSECSPSGAKQYFVLHVASQLSSRIQNRTKHAPCSINIAAVEDWLHSSNRPP